MLDFANHTGRRLVKKKTGDVDLEQSKYRIRKVSSHQRGNQNPQIEGQTTQWPNRKGQNDLQNITQNTNIE
jgi:hypothetical protein